MRIARLLPLALVGLAACDDERTVISRTDRQAAISLRDLPALQRDGGVAVEMHGTPFAGVDHEAIAAALRPPAGNAQETRFRAVPAGHGHGTRMVLHFNPEGAPNAQTDCERTAEAQTAPPRDRGFDMNLAICRDRRAVARGFLEALDTEPGDMEALTRAFQQLLMAIFADSAPGKER